MKLPISVKMSAITVVLLVVATVPIAMITSNYFEKTFREREENVNLDYATLVSQQIEVILTDLTRRTRAAGVSLLRSNESSSEFQDDFVSDTSILAVEIQSADKKIIKRTVKKNQVQKLCNCDPGIVDRAYGLSRFPIDSVFHDQIEIQNTTVRGGPPMFTIGIPLEKDKHGRITKIVLADFDLTVFRRPFEEAKERYFFAVDRRGVLIGHSDEQQVLNRTDFSEQEIVLTANKSTLARGQKRVVDTSGLGAAYVAYAKTRLGITVYSQIAENVILEPSREIRRQVFFVAGLVLSLALVIIFVFSMSLTSPIEKLAKLTDSISKGNFNTSAKSVVRAWFEDEVGQLAHAFDHMIEGLKERDKVKSLFAKFHGSSVAQDLMNRKTALEGENKDVIIFFSDIRGFTSYSESREASEVFTMLNEYFHEMVDVINTQGGVVDKFIGDAIMAVWGAPNSTKEDVFNSVMACLKMRSALAQLNERRAARGEAPLLIGMGLHAGSAISGIIGSDDRMEYTVIGNTVNTTSRVEAATKSFGTDLLVTEQIFTQVKNKFKFELAGTANVKGRTEGLQLYKVLGYYEEKNGDYVEVRTPYSEYEAGTDDKIKSVQN